VWTWLFDLDINMSSMQCSFAVFCEVYATWLSLGLLQYSNFQYFADKLCFLASYIHLASNLINKSLAVNVDTVAEF